MKSAFIKNIATTVLVVVVLSGGACVKDEVEKIDAVTHRDSVAGMHSAKVTTVISDSGITRYRIYTDQWDIYDKSSEPYWEFPKGLHFERFDENLVIDANFHANYGRYDERKKLWTFKDNVKAVNIEGKMFETDLLYWDQISEKIYSDKFIKITEETQVITSIGFESNQTLTKVKMKDTQGVFAIDEDKTATPNYHQDSTTVLR